MDDLAILAERLLRSNRELDSLLISEDVFLTQLPQDVETILRWAAGVRRTKGPSRDRVFAAVYAVRNNEALAYRELRFAAIGSCDRLEADGYRLIDDTGARLRLLAAIDRQDEPRRYRKLFGSLFQAYLATERASPAFKSAATEGHNALREYLERNLQRVLPIEPRTRWADVLSKRPTLLSESPGEEFAAAWLAGDTAEFLATVEALQIGSNSWLVADVARAALDRAVALNDHSFVGHIDHFLQAVKEPRFEALRDEVYARLLTRFALCRRAQPHVPLRDAVIAAWKAPWLTMNHAAWARVSEATRKMVEGWLKLELIHQFFDVLSDDRDQDRRRFEFWRGYHEQMDAVYFVLGSDADRHGDADWKKLKEAIEGRHLAFSGSRSTHAFIMYIGDRAIVEFSQTGNAAYFYRRTDLQIDPERRSVTTSWLKRNPPGDPMRHVDGASATWEHKFAHVLNGGLSRPSKAVVHNRWQAGEQSSRAVPMFELQAFAKRFALRIQDNRHLGGRLYVLTEDRTTAVNRQLERWGFTYSPGRGWWRAD